MKPQIVSDRLCANRNSDSLWQVARPLYGASFCRQKYWSNVDAYPTARGSRSTDSMLTFQKKKWGGLASQSDLKSLPEQSYP